MTLSYPETAFAPEVAVNLRNRRDVTLGVRPHAVRIDPEGPPAVVYANQWLGDQTHIAARFAGASLVSVAHHRAPVKRGEAIGIAISPDDLHIFDTASGRAFSHGRVLA